MFLCRMKVDAGSPNSSNKMFFIYSWSSSTQSLALSHQRNHRHNHPHHHHEEQEEEEGERGSSVVERSSLVPLHVTDPSHRLDLRHLSTEFGVLLVLALLKQVLVPSVSWVLIRHPAASQTEEEEQSAENLASVFPLLLMVNKGYIELWHRRLLLNMLYKHLLIGALLVSVLILTFRAAFTGN